MKLWTIIVGAVAFNAWLTYRGMKKNARVTTKAGLLRLAKAI